MSLGRPKTFQEAESLACMIYIVNHCQGTTDSQSILKQVETMFIKFLEQPSTPSKVIAAAVPAPSITNKDKKLDDLSAQINRFKNNNSGNSSKCKLVMLWPPMTSLRDHRAPLNPEIGREDTIPRLTNCNDRSLV